MSSIYIQEPSTSGKVLLKTSFGDIDIELWPREAPKACRNFVQLCLEGFYDGNIFHRVVKGFIAQTGDPTGTGTCGESIYGAPFKDEIHSRLRFVRRGLVACANGGKDDNGSQFFFTFAAAPELQGKHTIFGKVVGDTLYNLLKLEESLVDKEDDRPLYEQKIIKATVLSNPFDDIVPRVTPKNKEQEKSESKKEKKREKGVKNFKLLSFGDEAEEDEMETTIENKKFEGRSKSTHDVLNDPKLSSKSVSYDEIQKSSDSDEDEGSSQKIDTKIQLEDVRNKLKSGKVKEREKPKPKPKEESSDEEFMSREKKETKRELERIRKEMKDLKREYRREKKQKLEEQESTKKEQNDKSEILLSYERDYEKYLSIQKKIKPKGEPRQIDTLEMLKKSKAKFRETLLSTKVQDSKHDTDENDEDDEDSGWCADRFECDQTPVLAKDANAKTTDWYGINDPRNPMNKRRRDASKQQLKEKGKPKDRI